MGAPGVRPKRASHRRIATETMARSRAILAVAKDYRTPYYIHTYKIVDNSLNLFT